MIGLAARFAVSGGRESAARLVLTAIGVALGTALLLLAAAVEPAIRAQQERMAWQHTGRDDAELTGSGDPLRWQRIEDRVDDRLLVVLHVAGTGPSSPRPVGLDHVPAPDEVHVSPALADLMAILPPAQLADRFPSEPAGLIDDAFLAGPEDLVAVVGRPLAEMPSGPAVLDVHKIRTAPAPFQFSDVLRVGLGVAGVGLIFPIVVFVGTSTRLGAARREQRFAALRLSGATPRQTSMVAAVEAGTTALVGALMGLGLFHVVRPWVASVPLDGQRPFLADVAAAPAMVLAIIVGVTALAVAGSVRALRRLQISPLGVARRAPAPPPTARLTIPFVAGAVGLAGSLAWAIGKEGTGPLVAVMVTFALMIYGVVAAGPWLTALSARLIKRLGRRPASLLAARRLGGDPGSGFRAVSGLVVAVFVASVFSGVTPALLAENEQHNARIASGTLMQATLPRDTDAASAQRAAAAAVAAGGSDPVLVHRDPDPPRPSKETTGGPPPKVLLACRDVAALQLRGDCPRGGTARVIDDPDAPVEAAPYTEADLGEMEVQALVIDTDGTVAGADHIRTALQRELPGSVALTGTEDDSESNARLAQMERASTAALTLTLVIAGLGLAVAVAGGIIERRRPFTLLRLSGMHLSELRRVALVEAAAPLLLIAAASATLGLATSKLMIDITSSASWSPPAATYWQGLALGLAAATAISAATLPLLKRTTSPDSTRFE